MNTCPVLCGVWASGAGRRWPGDVLRREASGHTGGDGALVLVLVAITLLVFAGCSAQTAVAAVAAGSMIAVELQQRLR
ncbi:hypothetical protein AB0929_28535 [Streptomyces massasporeus]|uniref:hypothetical protein n=1 Tax=Streptomyces massasporeus TaxID=67324 RepID=UPI0034552435